MTSRDRTILAIVAVIAVIAGGWFVLIQPKRSEATKLQKQISAAQSQLQTERATVAAGLAARSTYSTYYAELARLGEAVPSAVDVPSMIYQVQSAATAARVDFRTLSLGSGTSGSIASSSATTAGPGGVTAQPINFTFNGSFFHVADFLHRLQQFVTASNREVAVSGRLMTLGSLSISAGPTGFPQITAQITATSYVLPGAQIGSPTAAASAGTPVAGTTTTSSSVPTSAAAVSTPVK